MGILRTIIWVLATAVLVIFAFANWKVVTITIWPGWEAETKLPLIVFAAFFIGTLPMWIALRATRWSLKRRLDTSERQLADMRAMANRPAEPVATPVATPAPASSPTPASGGSSPTLPLDIP